MAFLPFISLILASSAADAKYSSAKIAQRGRFSSIPIHVIIKSLGHCGRSWIGHVSHDKSNFGTSNHPAFSRPSNIYQTSLGLKSLSFHRGASIARKFALQYSVALLARKASNYEPVIKEIESAGGKAIGISTDVTDGASVANAFQKIKTAMNGAPLAAAIYNVGGQFIRKPFLELTEEEFMSGMEANGYVWNFLIPK